MGVGPLRLQEQKLRSVPKSRRVAGLQNPEDLSAKNFSVERIDAYSVRVGFVVADGQAASTSKLNLTADRDCLVAHPGRCATQVIGGRGDQLSGHRDARRVRLGLHASAAADLEVTGHVGPGGFPCHVTGGDAAGIQTLVSAFLVASGWGAPGMRELIAPRVARVLSGKAFCG